MKRIGIAPKALFVFCLLDLLFTGVTLKVSKHSIKGKESEIAREFIQGVAAQDGGSSSLGSETDWWLLWENGEGICFADMNLIRYPHADSVQIWLRWVVTEKGKVGEARRRTRAGLPIDNLREWDYTVSLFEIDCFNRMARLLDNLSYDREENPIDPAIIARWMSMWTNEWRPIPLRTEIGTVFKQLCR